MKCFHGNILTVDKENNVYHYLVEDAGRIAFAGDTLPEQYHGVHVIEMKDRALVPAFVDTHQHFASFSTFHSGLNVMDAASNAQIQDMMRDFVKEHPDMKTIIAFGASPYSVSDGRLISREELDKVCPDRDVFFVKYDGHACVVNSSLLKKVDKDVKGLRGYHPDTGEMNQEAFFKVSDFITGSINIIDLFRNMQKAADFEASKGIGCIHTVSGVGFTGNLDITFEKIFAKSLKNGLQVRVFPQSMDTKVATSRHLPRIGGCFACALDGCFGSHDASMNEPYVDEEGGSGVLYYSDEAVTDFCKRANRAGLQIEMHAIGDRAFDQAARAIKAALDDFPREDHRHGIIHDCLPTSEGLSICRDYHIQMPVQSAFIDWKQEPDEYLTKIMGADRVSRLNPLRTFLENNILVSFGSDAPCTTPDPIAWMDRAVNNKNASQAISIQDALRMCTYNGYFTSLDEKERGSLEPGKIADMAVLSKNPYAVQKEETGSLKVERLYLGGEQYRSCEGPVDSPAGITASLLEGLSYGVGDAVLGVNPAIDSPEDTANIWKALGELRDRLEIPTQTCVLSHVTTQMKAFESGARADLCFQSIAGTEAALSSFGVTTEMLSEARDMFLHGTATGPNVMYFETGQGSELSSGANFGWDQQTMECRCYGLARHYHPFLVNTVVGFMGPEYLYDAHQLLRAGLEDVFCGHLHGLPMGCDVCYTNHMPTDQNDIENLAVLLTAAGCHYFMGLPQGDDCMLMYQSTGYHDIAALRSTLGKKPIQEFNAWLEKYGILQDGQPGPEFGNPAVFGGEISVMQKSTPARIGIGHAGDRYTTAAALDFWEDQAAAADSVQKEVGEDTVQNLGVFEVSTLCNDKYEMLTRPDLGRLFSEETKKKISENCRHNADVQIYFGDGLCSPAIAANVPDLFPAIKAALEDEGYSVGTPFFVRYCRVNTARTIGPLLGARLTCVLIGERPGLLTNESMSAYMALNARPEMSESDYRVVSNISRVGLPPVEAAAEISDMMLSMLGQE